MILYLLRGAFILLALSVTLLYILPFQEAQGEQFGVNFTQVVLMVAVTVGICAAIVAADIFIREKRLSALSGIFLGLIGGLVVAYALSHVVNLVFLITVPDPGRREALAPLNDGVNVVIGLVTCYLGISLVIQTKDDFRFIVPYVEFAKQIRGTRPALLDTSVIIDGRIVDIIATQVLQGPMIVPKFVLNELQLIADSPDKLRRARGRRGLETLQKLQEGRIVDITIQDADVEGLTVDQKLVSMAQATQARIMTNDYNLNKIATLRGVDVINLNDLAKALRPVVLPGEALRVRVIKPGESNSQAVGYLDDGTMVVVENARQALGHEVDLVVTSTLQTSAGRMIFGRYTGSDEAAATATAGASDTAPRRHAH